MLTVDQFNKQRARAKHRKDINGNQIEFHLTFEQWCTIWEESGHAEERGKHKGQYVMARHGDIGHYEVGNVSIVTVSENLREKNFRTRGVKRGPLSEETRRKISQVQTGVKRGKYKPWSDEARANLSKAMKGKSRKRTK